MKRGRPPKHPVQQYDESMRLLIEAQTLKRGGAKRINEKLAGANRQPAAVEKARYRAEQFVMHDAAAAIDAEIEKLKNGTALTAWISRQTTKIGTPEQLAEIVIAEVKKAFKKPDKK